MQLKWPGPSAGISQSMINRFLLDPYEFYLYAALGLRPPREYKPNLAWGDTFHVGLEHLLDNIKEPDRHIRMSNAVEAMAEHLHYYPMAERTFHKSCAEMLKLYDDKWALERPTETEVVFFVPYEFESICPSPAWCKADLHCRRQIHLTGKYDVVSYDIESYFPKPVEHKHTLHCPALMLGEHKCKGYVDRNQTREETPYDLQLNLYCLTARTERVVFDTIKIPDVQWKLPPKRRMEEDSAYIRRLYHEHADTEYPISRKKHLWLDQFTVPVPTSSQERWASQTLNPILERICQWYDYIARDDFDPENPRYNHIFYKTPIRHFNSRKTDAYKSEYHNLLVNNWSTEQLEPVESYYSELEI
jgi:hypothetical protein